MNILDRIKELYPQFTRKQKSIADYMMTNPGDICYITLAQLSHNTSSSELTLLRFCQKVGCSNFLELKDEFRDYTQHMIQKVSAPDYVIPANLCPTESEKLSLILNLCQMETEGAAEFFSKINPDYIAEICKTIKNKKRILIFAHDISKIPGEFLAFRMKLLFLNVSLVDLEDIAETQKQLETLSEDDMVVFFSFPKYYFPLESIAKEAKKSGASILTITNSYDSPAAPFSHYILICQTETKIFYNTLTLPIAMINLISSYLAVDLLPPAKRQDFIDTLSS